MAHARRITAMAMIINAMTALIQNMTASIDKMEAAGIKFNQDEGIGDGQVPK